MRKNEFYAQAVLRIDGYATIGEIAKAEKINPSHVSPGLGLTLLAPATVAAIPDGRRASPRSPRRGRARRAAAR